MDIYMSAFVLFISTIMSEQLVSHVWPQSRVTDNFISGISIRIFHKVNKYIQYCFKTQGLVHQSHVVMHM